MAKYDPFARGPHPVGVRTVELHDAVRGRTFPVEVWYPAQPEHTGQDLDDATRDTFEILAGMPGARQDAVRDADALDEAGVPIVFSHGFAGHRRQTTHLCTHLASHGYVVAAPDHVGNTTADVIALMMSGAPMEEFADHAGTSADDRPLDASQTLDALLSGELGVRVSTGEAGITGHSFGGWTTLQTTGKDPRITAALPLAPAGGRWSADMGPAEAIADALDLQWDRAVPTLMIVADEDSVLPIAGMHDLLARSEALDRMVVVVNADHYHFCDSAEAVHDMMAPMMGSGAKTSAELVPGADAYTVTTGLGLAHFDSVLRGSAEAEALLAGDLVSLFAGKGIVIEVIQG